MRKCEWCDASKALAIVSTPLGSRVRLCRDCRAINTREMRSPVRPIMPSLSRADN